VALLLPGALPALLDAPGLVESFHLARDPSLGFADVQKRGELTLRL
jgi:hypothetical protein